jgi:peptide/nickel transport system permease protein
MSARTTVAGARLRRLRDAVPTGGGLRPVAPALAAALVAALAVAAPWLAGASAAPFADIPFARPGGDHLLGTDAAGADVLRALGEALRVTLASAVAAGLLAALAGGAAVAAAALAPRAARALRALVAPLLALPAFALAFGAAAAAAAGTDLPGSRATQLAAALGIGLAPRAGARIAVALAPALHGPLADRLRLAGARPLALVRRAARTTLPHALAAAAVEAAALAAGLETTLSLLGAGDAARPSLGGLLRAARASGADAQGAWWTYVPAAACTVLVIGSLQLLVRDGGGPDR